MIHESPSKVSQPNLFDRKSCRCYSCQDGFVPPVEVGLDAPVETKDCHQDDHDEPEEPAEPGLVGEEDVDQALKN